MADEGGEERLAANPVVAAWLFDIVAAADVLVDRLRGADCAATGQIAEALDRYIQTRNRHARPGSGHRPRLNAMEDSHE